MLTKDDARGTLTDHNISPWSTSCQGELTKGRIGARKLDLFLLQYKSYATCIKILIHSWNMKNTTGLPTDGYKRTDQNPVYIPLSNA